KELRRRLKERASIATLRKDLELRAADGTIKYRFQTSDGRLIEAVYMPAEDRRTLCVSTQAGCAMACTFCMTATLGLQRHRTAGVIGAEGNGVKGESARGEGGPPRPLTNLASRGMGEPLHNFENLKPALVILQSEGGPIFPHRHITVSTVGL